MGFYFKHQKYYQGFSIQVYEILKEYGVKRNLVEIILKKYQ